MQNVAHLLQTYEQKKTHTAWNKRIMDQKQQFPNILLQIKIPEGKLLCGLLTSTKPTLDKFMLAE